MNIMDNKSKNRRNERLCVEYIIIRGVISMYNELLFCRQFILGSKFVEIEGWNKIPINEDLFLTIHPDLKTSQSTYNNINLTLLGYMIDPSNNYISDLDILNNICKNSKSFIDVLKNTYNYNGRWIIIYNDKNETKVFNDCIGSRQLCYVRKNNEIWCASQSSLLSYCLNIELDDNDLLTNFIKSSEFEMQEKFLPGDSTLYRDVKHLIPNHYLDLNLGKSIRYYPSEHFKNIQMNDAIEFASKILQGSMVNANKRFNLMLAITGGLDSRVALAASKDIKQDIFYYLMKFDNLNDNHLDIQIPSKLLPKLNLNFNLLELDKNIDENFEKRFNENVSCSRNKLKYGAYICYKEFKDKVRISGHGSEIGRNFYYGYYNRKIDAELLAEISGYKNNEFAILHFKEWLFDAEDTCKKYNMNILDLFYWEQRMGKWGALGSSEFEIANEEFILFNNRQLLNTILQVDEKYRIDPNYILYKKIINRLWPSTLSTPINGKSKLDIYIKYFAKYLLKKMHLFDIAKKVFKYKKMLKAKSNISN
jgi:hypothetical protein